MELCVFKGHLAYQAYPFSGCTHYRAADLRQISAAFSHLGMKDWSVSNLPLLLHHDSGSRPQLKVRFCKRPAHCWLKSFTTFYPKWCSKLSELVSGSEAIRARLKHATEAHGCSSLVTGAGLPPGWHLRWGAVGPKSSLENLWSSLPAQAGLWFPQHPALKAAVQNQTWEEFIEFANDTDLVFLLTFPLFSSDCLPSSLLMTFRTRFLINVPKKKIVN